MENVKAVQSYLEREIILNPSLKQPLILIKAIRNGAVYGTKVRFPHALVMVFLFRSGTVREKLYLIFKATRQHAINLAKFAFLYKSTVLLLENTHGALGSGSGSGSRSGSLSGAKAAAAINKKEASFHSFLAGLVGGYYVFGSGRGAMSSVNQQICIYVFARVVLAFAKLAFSPPGDNSLVGGRYGGRGGKGFVVLDDRQRELVRRMAWPAFASLSWASVMWLFRWYPDMLQPSLKSSMTYIYSNADEWDGLRNFLWHNK